MKKESLGTNKVQFIAENDVDKDFINLLMEGIIWDISRGKPHTGVEKTDTPTGPSIIITLKDKVKTKS